MLHINDLPLIVVESILDYATEADSQDISRSWEDSLCLLSVCRSWRSIASRLVFKTAYVVIEEPEENKEEDSEEATNIDLLSTANITHMVRSVHIVLDNQVSLVRFLGKYADMFNFGNSSWIRARCFDMTINEVVKNNDELFINEPHSELTSVFSSFANQVVKNMPNVAQLSFDINPITNLNTLVTSRLINGFQNLSSIESNCYTVFDSKTHFTSLTRLTIKFMPNTDFVFPYINPDIIQHIHITNVPPTFSWHPFLPDTSADKLVFKSLTYLNIKFTKPEDQLIPNNSTTRILQYDTSHKLHVHFPNLSKLFIRNKTSVGFDSSVYVFPKYLDTIAVTNSISTLQLLQRAEIKLIDRVVLFFDVIGQTDEANFYKLTNYFAGTEGLTNYSRICLWRLGFEVDVSRIKWSQLLQLHMVEVTELSWLFGLIKNIPDLCNLTIASLYINSMPAHVSGLMSQSNRGSSVHLDLPLNNNITKLAIMELNSDGCSPNEVAMYIKHMVIQLPGIKHLHITDAEWMEMDKFASKHKQWYPHIGDITFTYGL
ncbi:hypothetical protein LPJ66_008239 [Kickxella alabastrina]|uniref:Uncharacterized protein n=1 Tax=Kickxella alabastrina TaxID=61397 RepID=A0ACC1I797_9FUNG|nr:hypothetical protein LPJ66_008239 [Kickxella alabastrina]